MHSTIRRARPAVGLTVALAATLLVPGAALAATAEPSPVTTTAGPTATTTTTTTTAPTTGTTTTTATGQPTGTTTTSSTNDSPTTTGTETAGTKTVPSTTTGPTTPPATKKLAPTTGEAGLVPGGSASRHGLLDASAGPTTSTDPALVGAHYLASELGSSEGVFYTLYEGTKYYDWGLTADVILALDAAGASQDQAATSTKLLAANVKRYITGVDFGAPDDVSAGSTAKLLNVAVAQQADPRAFGGVDLIGTLLTLISDDGLFVDKAATNYTNTLGQALAVIGLERATGAAPAKAVTGLRSLQCPDGGFGLYYPKAGDTGCTSDPDATSYAVQALIAAAGVDDADVQQALQYLTDQQTATGGVGGGGPQTAVNANSTGLAGQAFVAGGRSAQARLAASYLTGLQYGCGVPAALRGGVAYNQAAYDAQVAAGAEAAPSDQDRRSTAQALLTLASTPLFAVTSTGATSDSPALACAAPSSSTSSTGSTSSTTTPATTGAATTSSTTSTGGVATTTTTASSAAPVASGVPGGLAFTGSNVAAIVALAVLLLLAGAASLVLARRKGVHA